MMFFLELNKSLIFSINSKLVLEIIKCEFDAGIRLHLADCVLKEDVSIHDLKQIGHYEIMSVLKSEGNKHRCLTKIIEPKGFKEQHFRSS